MAFSFFTKPTEYTSRRLRFIARGLQVFGIVAAVALTLTSIMLAKSVMMQWPEEMRDAYLRRSLTLAIGQCVSFFFIGRALLRRQRSGAYLATLTIGVPLILGLLARRGPSNMPLVFDAVSVGLPIVTLGLIASVWRELGSIRDSEFVDHRPAAEPEIPLTPRNRGFGEPRPTAKVPPFESPPDSALREARVPVAANESEPIS